MTAKELMKVTETLSPVRKTEVVRENMFRLTHELLADFYKTRSLPTVRVAIQSANCMLRSIRVGGKYYTSDSNSV